MVSMSPTHKKTYRVILISILLILMIPFSFLMFMGSVAIHKYYAITPYDFPGSVWESQEPFIHLEVSNPIGNGINGSIIINGKEKKVCLSTTAGSDAKLLDSNLYTQSLNNGTYYSEMVLLRVIWNCSENQIVMKIEEDNIYDGKYKRIVLDRVE